MKSSKIKFSSGQNSVFISLACITVVLFILAALTNNVVVYVLFSVVAVCMVICRFIQKPMQCTLALEELKIKYGNKMPESEWSGKYIAYLDTLVLLNKELERGLNYAKDRA